MEPNNDFTTALKFTAEHEGFFSNDKADPGGKTKYGISDAGDGTIDGLIDLDRDGDGDVPVEELTEEQAIEYLFNHYWKAAGCNSISVIDFGYAVFTKSSSFYCRRLSEKALDRYGQACKIRLW